MLVKCKACGGQISQSATICPTCGHPNRRGTRLALIALLVVAGSTASIAWQKAQNRAANQSAAMSVVTELIRGYEANMAGGESSSDCVKASQIADLYDNIGNTEQSDVWRSRSAPCATQPST